MIKTITNVSIIINLKRRVKKKVFGKNNNNNKNI